MSGSTEHYKEEYCQMLIDHMTKGYSFGSFGAVAHCGRTTLYAWAERHPEFKAAKEEGVELAKRMFEQIALAKVVGRKQTDSKGEVKFDPKLSDTTMLIFLMKTRFHDTYGDRVKHDIGDVDIGITIDAQDAGL